MLVPVQSQSEPSAAPRNEKHDERSVDGTSGGLSEVNDFVFKSSR